MLWISIHNTLWISVTCLLVVDSAQLLLLMSGMCPHVCPIEALHVTLFTTDQLIAIAKIAGHLEQAEIFLIFNSDLTSASAGCFAYRDKHRQIGSH